LIDYLESQTLDIYFADDNKPIDGIVRGGQSNANDDEAEDLIGIARIPLQPLVKNLDIIDNFKIVDFQGVINGSAKIRISVIDPGQGTANQQQKTNADVRAIEMQSFDQGWEKDITMRIARKLGRLSIDVELMFGIFSRGSKICTREDFKYCCLQRLDLKREISDREIELLLESKIGQRANID
jgi:hypothetical protein